MREIVGAVVTLGTALIFAASVFVVGVIYNNAATKTVDLRDEKILVIPTNNSDVLKVTVVKNGIIRKDDYVLLANKELFTRYQVKNASEDVGVYVLDVTFSPIEGSGMEKYDLSKSKDQL